MELKIEWSENADARMDEIFNYYKEVASSKIARKVVKQIYSRATILTTNPYVGQREELLKNRIQEFRYLIEGNYKIIYCIYSDKILILTVFDCRQNPEKMGKELPKDGNGE